MTEAEFIRMSNKIAIENASWVLRTVVADDEGEWGVDKNELTEVRRQLSALYEKILINVEGGDDE
jgi:hypothetical protein